MKKTGLLCAAIILAGSMLPAQDPPQFRGVYVPTFDTRTQAQCDAVIADVLASNLNQVFVQVRSRADAYYYPNREDATYPNTEPRGQLWQISPSDLDVLQYYIDRLHNANPPREVIAWLTTYNTWSTTSRDPASSAHVFHTHPEWRTENLAGVTYGPDSDAPLDPGIPAVQDYLYNVFMDVVRNYDIDGIHFDYVRLIASDAGFDALAKAQFLAETGWNIDTDNGAGQLGEVYEAWRRDQISRVVQRVHTQTMLEKPWVDTSAFLVNFDDSVERLAQGYNWWVANDAIDVLYPGCYSSSVAGTVDDWNFYVSKLSQNGDQYKRPLGAAIGSYLFLDTTPPAPERNLQSVATLEANARKPDGYVFFANGALFDDGISSSDELAQDLFNTGGLMDQWAPIPTIAHKVPLGEETVVPNAPASAAVTLSEGTPLVSFSRPAPAGDGDLPVHYRLYRDTDSNVDLYYDNMVMEWWDPNSQRTDFSFEDTESPGGNTWYAVVAYDDWNNRAVTTVGPVAVVGNEHIIETRTGGLNLSDYSEPSGTFTNSTSHSTAPGLTAGIGSRFVQATSAAGRDDIARFTPSVSSGEYEVFVTCFGFASANAEDITVRFSDREGTRTQTIDLTDATAGNQWLSLGTMTIDSGSGHFVEFDNSTQSNLNATGGWRMNAAATRFVRASTPAQPKEPKPAVHAVASSVTEVIVDSTPQALNYDDAASSDNQPSAIEDWGTSTLSGYYNGNARYVLSTNLPLQAYAVWLVDLPRSGRWAIDGYVRNSNALATAVQYRFVDATGTVRDVTTTQRTGTENQTTGGWYINIDGTDDANAYSFDAGRVYITLYGNAAGQQTLIADALRMRLVEADSFETHWSIY